MLGLSVSSAATATSPHRRFSPSLYPPPAPSPSPGRLAGSGSGSAASRFGQIPPSTPRGRQRRTRALPTPFLSELASIRRMSASLFGDLDARPTNHRGATRQALHAQQQAWPSPVPTMSLDSGLRAPPPSGTFSQVPPPVSRRPQPPPPSPGVPPLSGNRFAGFPASAFWSQRRQVQSSSSGVPPLVSQQQKTTYQPSSSTDLAPLPSGSGIFPGLAPPPASSKSSFTDLMPLPGDELTTMFGSSSLSSSAHLEMQSQDQTPFWQWPSDSELHPSPPSLEMQSQDQRYSEFEAPILDVAVAPAPGFQIKEEPMDDAPCIERQPELISLDDDEDDGLNALLQSFQSSSDLDSNWMQLGGCSGSRPREMGAFDGSGQSWEATMMLTPAYDNVSIANPNLQFPLLPSSTDTPELNSSDGPSVWSTADTSGEGWAGMPALAGMFDQMSIGEGTLSIGQGWPAAPAAGGQYCMFDDNSGSSAWPAIPSCATSMLDQVTIGGGSMSGMGQGWPETPAAADDAGVCVFDNSGSSTNPWPEMPSFATSMLDQVTIGGGSMGQGWPETPAPAAAAASNYAMFDIDITAGGSSSSSSGAWASKPWNISSSSMENSTPVPKLILGGMEKPRLPRQLPSRAAVASSSMSRRGTYGDLFSVAEMEMINKDKRLKEIVNTDPKRVKRYEYL
ncbi:uncharacterized protein LOC120662559 [Panicum virgatum]|uniref:uncharacterized protein LOC120662559 n=1 Tax=Panicum virgatum TaxID=38727 RepID=UPI0019D509C9|nr:uncharacterized protein LOC120662559 [Panicum virgatum]